MPNSATPEDASVDARRGPSLAEPARFTTLKRARCSIPDGGALVTVFDAHELSPADCDAAPWSCRTSTARAEVLRRFDAGVLEFPSPVLTTRTDARGWFEVALEKRGLLVVECADGLLFHAPSGFDESFTDPTVELSPVELRLRPVEGKVLVVNPWTRRAALVDGASLNDQPLELVGHSWATVVDGTALKTPMELGLSDGLGFGSMFGNSVASAPSSPTSVKLVVRARPIDLSARAVRLQVSTDGGAGEWVDTRLLEHAFDVEPGRVLVRARMPGALPREVTVDARTVRETELRLEPGIATTGTVVDAAGQPVSGATVERDGLQAFTDVSGRFDFELDDAQGEARRDQPCEDAGFVGSSPCRALVRVRASQPSVGASDEVVVSRPGPLRLVLTARSDVSLRVEAPDGGGVFGLARISSAGNQEDLTRTVRFDTALIRDGALALDGLSRGRHDVLVLTREWKADRFSVEVGASPLRMTRRLEEKPVVEGVVFRGRQPAAGVRVQFARPPAIFGYDEDQTRTDEKGAFRLGRSLAGPATLVLDGRAQKRPVPVPSRLQRLELAR